MKNKGFTLIELIGTIVILSLILLVIVPPISNSLKKGIDKADKQIEESIIMAAKNYSSDNKNAECVDLSTLQEEGYIDKNLKSPKDNEEITNKKVIITIDKTPSGEAKYSYEYEEGNCN